MLEMRIGPKQSDQKLPTACDEEVRWGITKIALLTEIVDTVFHSKSQPLTGHQNY